MLRLKINSIHLHARIDQKRAFRTIGWRIIATYEVVQRLSKKDFYVQNYTFPSFTRNAWTCAHRIDVMALDVGRSVTGRLPATALLFEIREQPNYRPLNQGAK
jgi:hypothetical protein